MKIFLSILLTTLLCGCSNYEEPERGKSDMMDAAIALGRTRGQLDCIEKAIPEMKKSVELDQEIERQNHNDQVLRVGTHLPDIRKCLKQYEDTRGNPDSKCVDAVFGAMYAMGKEYRSK